MHVDLAHDVIMRDTNSKNGTVVSAKFMKRHGRRDLHVGRLKDGPPDLIYRFGGVSIARVF